MEPAMIATPADSKQPRLALSSKLLRDRPALLLGLWLARPRSPRGRGQKPQQRLHRLPLRQDPLQNQCRRQGDLACSSMKPGSPPRSTRPTPVPVAMRTSPPSIRTTRCRQAGQLCVTVTSSEAKEYATSIHGMSQGHGRLRRRQLLRTATARTTSCRSSTPIRRCSS